MAGTSSRIQACCLLALTPALALLTPDPGTALATAGDLAGDPGTTDPTLPLVAVVALSAWTCTAWLSVVLLATCCTRMPGSAGRRAHWLTDRIAPSSVRALVRVATGLTVTGAVLAGPSALAAEPGSGPAGVRQQSAPGQEWSLDWPTTPSVPTGSPARASVVPTPGAGTAATDAVVVRPGDSLWSIARAALDPQATPSQVAQAWPRWWSANRAVLGHDPDLIHPGTRLINPTR